ncbi:predicted protein [Sclerotinia sclerotiorum 1980 UF-70]|uniref:Uncharacterized protein n=1 Tax=Sclerotinia sclerotiorum (strain ATCC 18683 / 1980 / Ss-1) TaxID=665079 RepID=A7E8B1_SCLS1|nr:predicted protein [Sclerotinia sclerotiorum 1980 UF-70]EDN96613.1 predicted protein [Sclerotinia sclerotiorum 1980 UF-70]
MWSLGLNKAASFAWAKPRQTLQQQAKDPPFQSDFSILTAHFAALLYILNGCSLLTPVINVFLLRVEHSENLGCLDVGRPFSLWECAPKMPLMACGSGGSKGLWTIGVRLRTNP